MREIPTVEMHIRIPEIRAAVSRAFSEYIDREQEAIKAEVKSVMDSVDIDGIIKRQIKEQLELEIKNAITSAIAHNYDLKKLIQHKVNDAVFEWGKSLDA